MLNFLSTVEHNVKFSEGRRAGRRVDMASFFSLLDQIAEPSGNQTPQHNPHATPTPVDTAALFRLLQDQLNQLHTTAPTSDNREFLESLILTLEDDINDPPTRLAGVSQEFVDSLDRVNRKNLKKDDDCAICKVPYLEDEYCLVVELPCQGAHQFDLECVGPWLRSKGTCPMCRQEMGKKKEVPIVEDDEEEDGDMMYA
ncbi:zinc finger domain-containing protein [Fusarium heterosporum]|uniref:Zinc finger domain-containing protein n=1 Tax=Fusarium heterosporum TaxID=42747 RepID=A0A8H5SRT1_FUSHE|nr:zinc finger domain-containing protein [Fusarium heterosporum]